VRALLIYPGRPPSDDRRCRPDHLSWPRHRPHQPRQQPKQRAGPRFRNGHVAKVQKGPVVFGLLPLLAMSRWHAGVLCKDNTGACPPLRHRFSLARPQDPPCTACKFALLPLRKSLPARPRSALRSFFRKGAGKPRQCFRGGNQIRVRTGVFAKAYWAVGSVGHGPGSISVRALLDFRSAVLQALCRIGCSGAQLWTSLQILRNTSARGVQRGWCQAQATTCPRAPCLRALRGAWNNVGAVAANAL